MGSFPFMKLPLELRDKVYSYGLMVEGHITPYPEYYRYCRDLDYKGDKLRSFIGLLSVSKAVHEEAAVILYGKNTFRISAMAKELTYNYMMYDANGPEESIKETLSEDYYPTTLWTKKGHLVRHAVIYYHYNDYDHTKHVEKSIQALHDSPHDTDNRAGTLHQYGVFAIQRTWHSKGFHRWRLQNLATLRVNVTDLYCPTGCCRWEILSEFFSYPFLPPYVLRKGCLFVVEGLKSEAELDLITDVRDRAPDCTIDAIPATGLGSPKLSRYSQLAVKFRSNRLQLTMS